MPFDPNTFDPSSFLQSLGNLNQNVSVPSDFMGHPTLARGLDNALLSMATMQNGPTIGSNISNVARNLMGLGPERVAINMNRQLAPYEAMNPLIQMQGELSKQSLESAQTQESLDKGYYFRQGGRQLNAEKYVDDSGKVWQLLNNGEARPFMGDDGSGNGPQQITGNPARATNSTELERQLNFEDAQRVANGQPPMTATERGNRMLDFYGARSGAQTTGRINNTPGFMSDTAKEGLKNDLGPIDKELDRLNNMTGVARLMENSIASHNNAPSVEQRINDLTSKRNQVLNKYIPQGSTNSASPATAPQPVVSPATDQRGPGLPSGPTAMIGNTPVQLGGGATLGDLRNAIVPPGPAAPPKPAKPAKVASSSRPKVTIDSKGNVSVQ